MSNQFFNEKNCQTIFFENRFNLFYITNNDYPLFYNIQDLFNYYNSSVFEQNAFMLKFRLCEEYSWINRCYFTKMNSDTIIFIPKEFLQNCNERGN